MTTHKIKPSSWKLALTFLLLTIITGCSNGGVEPTGREPAKTAPALSRQEVEMLQVAAKGDNTRVKALLDQGVGVNMLGGDHNTPIMEAAYAGHLDTVKLLLDHGADLSVKKNDGATPTGLAGAHKDVVDLFKNVSALVEAAAKGDNKALKELIEKGAPVNGLDQTGRSALTEASWNGKTDIVKLLLEKGANPTIKKSDGETPLSLATSQKHPDIVALLNEAIAKQAKSTPTPPAEKGTPATQKPAAK